VILFNINFALGNLQLSIRQLQLAAPDCFYCPMTPLASCTLFFLYFA